MQKTEANTNEFAFASVDIAGFTLKSESYFVKFLVPFREVTQSLAQRCVWLKAEVTFESRRVCIGYGNVTGLHRNELFVCVEIIVGR